ncbi:MAG: TAXI family TRAP transporter solute-binding subunit [Ahrensia sp.]
MTDTDLRRVNRASRKARQMRTLFSLALIAVLAVVGGYFWLDSANTQRETLTVASGPLGSDTYILMKEVADVVDRHSETLRLQVQTSSGASSNIAQLNAAKVDTGVIRADTPVVSNIRVIATLYPDVMQIITRASSGVTRINDLAGVRVSVPPFGTDGFKSFWILGDHYDLPIGTMKWASEPFEIGAAKLLAGQTDAFFVMRSLRDARLIRLFEDAQLKGLKLSIVPIDQAQAIAVKRPFLDASLIPKGSYTGATPVPARDTTTSSVDRILVSRDDTSPDAIRELTRILFEHRLDLTIRFSLASAIQKPDDARGLSVPLHEGAQAYYNRDEPSFIQENAEPLALMVTVFTLLLSSLFALRSRFNASQKNRADTYNHQLLTIQKNAILEDDPQELAAMKIELNNVLQTVVIALDTDDVTEEGFQSFSLLWGAVRETINDRLKAVAPSQ